MYRSRLLKLRAAYTLIEMIVASTASSVLLVGMATSIVISSSAFDTSDGEIHQSIAAGQHADEIMTEMRYATRFHERTANTVAFNVPDRDGDGSEETLRYSWSGVAGEPLTKEFNGSSAAVLIPNVQALNFTYMTRTIASSIPPIVFTPQVVFEGFTEATSKEESNWLAMTIPPGESNGDLLIAALA